MQRPRILLVEDDEAIASGLLRVLDGQGYAVSHLSTGAPALHVRVDEVDLVLLDLGLPDIDGVDVCRTLRGRSRDLPIVILTARDEEADVVAGLDSGADDYLVKPFRLSELLARVRAHLRRTADSRATGPAIVEVRDLRIDLAARRVWRDDVELALRPKEFDLLALLAAEAGRAVGRDRIMWEVWDTEWLGSTKTLDTHVLSLRGKVGPEAVTTLRGFGYRLETE